MKEEDIDKIMNDFKQDDLYWNSQRIEPQDLTDIQENTRILNRLVFATWVAIGIGLIFLLFWAYTWYFFDRHNIIWSVLNTCRGMI